MTANSNNDPNRLLPVRMGAFAVVALVSGWLIFSPSSVYSQLRATPEEITKIYGPVFRHNARLWHRQFYDGSVVDGDIYKKDEIYVRVVFRQDKAVLLEFSRIDDALKQKDIDAMLSASAEGSHWEMGKDSTLEAKFYRRVDDLAIAQWAIGYDGSLLISAEEPTWGGDKFLR